MAQPVEFTRQQDYTEFQDFNAEGTELNREFDDLKITLDQIRVNLDLLQKDDGQLSNDSVGEDQMQDSVFGTILQAKTDTLTAEASALLAKTNSEEIRDQAGTDLGDDAGCIATQVCGIEEAVAVEQTAAAEEARGRRGSGHAWFYRGGRRPRTCVF